MKKILLLFVILLMLGVVTNSCISERVIENIENPNQDPDPTPNPTPSEKKLFRLSASVETPTLQKLNVNSDNIGLFIYKDIFNSIGDERSVRLGVDGYYESEITSSDSVGYCFAYFPYSSSSISGTNYTGFISSTQDQVASTSNAIANIPTSIVNQMLMVSDRSNTINFKDEIAKIQFRNVFSLFCFEITKDNSISFLFDNQRISSFELYMAGTDTLVPLHASYTLAGQYSIDIKKTAEGSTPIRPEFLSGYSSVITSEITNSPVITSDNPIYIWILVPPFNFYANKLVARMETVNDNGSISFKTFSTFSGYGDISRNTLTTFPINLTSTQIFSDNLIKYSFADEPANSYIISEPGVYQISTKKPTGAPVNAGNDATATWLWASKAGGGNTFDIEELISSISYNSADSTIMFRVGSDFKELIEGNVILALRDVNGNILWTWHIWITDNPKSNVSVVDDFFLDRNLGALSADIGGSAVDNYGFVYQWGRKDPFFGGDGMIYNESSDYLSVARTHTKYNPNNELWQTGANLWSKSIQYSTVNDAIKYPMRFICNTKSGTLESDISNPADWLSVGENNFWRDNEKTDYDPCPHGYKVPGKNDLSMLHNTNENAWWYFKRNASNNNYWELFYSSAPVLVWPAAGMRQGRNNNALVGAQLMFSGIDNLYGRCYYWTSTPVDLAGINKGGSYRFYTNENTIYETEFGDNADAYPVRCVKIK